MFVALVTRSGGLIGSETRLRFHELGFDIVGIANDLRAWFRATGFHSANSRSPDVFPVGNSRCMHRMNPGRRISG